MAGKHHAHRGEHERWQMGTPRVRRAATAGSALVARTALPLAIVMGAVTTRGAA